MMTSLSGFPDPVWTQLVRYFSGDCSAAEAEALERWIDGAPGRRGRVDALRVRWESVRPKQESWESSAMWAQLQQSLADASSKEIPTAHWSPAPRVKGQHRKLARTWRIGPMAGTALAILLGIAGWQAFPGSLGPSAPETTLVRDYTTARGQQATVDLPDGSVAVLGPASHVRFTRSSDGERVVHLRGEAYFTVATDPAHPFVVQSAVLTTRVLGTAFAVRALDDAEARIVVTEGKVAVQAPGVRTPVTLLAGDIARTGSETPLLVSRDTTVGAFLRWTVGQLTFDEIPFSQIVPELERWYNVEIRTTDPELARQPVTIVLDVTAGRRAFASLAAILGAHLVYEDNRVTFTRQSRSLSPSHESR